ncbi:hypothetical protein ACE6H2_027167 [Prunus campanulata]
MSFFKAVALCDGRTAAECTLRLSKQHKFQRLSLRQMQFLNDILNSESLCYKFPSLIIYILYLILVYIWPKFLIFFFLQQVEEAFAFWGTPEGDLVYPECMQQLLEKVRRRRVNVDGNVCTHCHGTNFGSCVDAYHLHLYMKSISSVMSFMAQNINPEPSIAKFGGVKENYDGDPLLGLMLLSNTVSLEKLTHDP